VTNATIVTAEKCRKACKHWVVTASRLKRRLRGGEKVVDGWWVMEDGCYPWFNPAALRSLRFKSNPHPASADDYLSGHCQGIENAKTPANIDLSAMSAMSGLKSPSRGRNRPQPAACEGGLHHSVRPRRLHRRLRPFSQSAIVNVNLVNRRVNLHVNLAIVQNPQCLCGLLTC